MGEINDDDDALLRRPPRGKDTDIAKPDSSPLGEVRRGLLLLMECKAPDGRYLVTRKVHWQAVYRVLVDAGWYDASLGKLWQSIYAEYESVMIDMSQQ